MPRLLTLALATLLVPTAALALTADITSPTGLSDPALSFVVGSRWVDATTGATVAAFDLDAGPFSGSPEMQARSYLSREADMYGLESATEDLELVSVQETPLGWTARFQQTVFGFPVFEGDVAVTIARSGRVVAVTSRYHPAAEAIATAAAIRPETARELAIAAISCSDERHGPETPPALGLLAGQGRLHELAYRLVIPAMDPLGDWEVMVDATNGRILRVRDQAVYIDGNAVCFDPDPLTTAHVAYGTPGYVDGNDANTPELEAQTFPRTLRDISFSTGLYRLTGPYVNIQDFESPSSPPATSPTTDFIFTRDAQGFEDTEVYYGIDQNQRYIQALGYNTIQNLSIWCDPHGLSGADNSHYIPSTNRLAWGEGGVDDAEDMDVILHEYGHAIQNGTVPGWGTSTDARSMGEGFGDYWAGSYSAGIDLYRWEWVFNWDGHNPFWGGRILNDPRIYPNSWGTNIYSNGTIWASCLMQIWFEITRETMDQIVLGHHFLLSAGSSVTQAAAALVTTDRNLNEGLNVDSIVYFCTARGFFTSNQYEIPAITHTPLPDQTVPGPYTVTAVCTSPGGISAVEVRYGLAAVTNSAPMTPTGNPNEYSGQIPDLGNGTIHYFLAATNNANNKLTDPRPAPDGGVHTFEVSGSNGIAASDVTPGRFAFAGNTPNPFNPSTTITYSLGARVPVRLAVYSPAGTLVRVLVDAPQEATAHAVTWDGRDDLGRSVASGLYLVRLEAGKFSATGKMMLLK